MQYQFNSLNNYLLVAMPSLNNTYFTQSVILVCEHNEKGSMGIVINRPLDITVAEILLRMRVKNHNDNLKDMPVLSGGPTKTNKTMMLSYTEDDNLILNKNDDAIRALADNHHPDPFIITLGHCLWEAGQLEQELVNNNWLTMIADPEIIFNIPFEQQWRECTYNLGINELHNLSSYGGHA
ncbi:MAG: YqgE/AlgH family protein [Gammaproteobacteria bacterium]|nr:YqgE/AlgH family protein [Gammaproteobacteria bacterium]